jgi:hypothetical protein
MPTDPSSPLAVLVQCALIGIVWGATNPFVRRGTIAVEQKKRALEQRQRAAASARGPRPSSSSSSSSSSSFSSLALALTTPAFLVPQLLNQSGGVVFSALLASGAAPLSVAVPAVNAAALAANALADVLLGEKYRLKLLVPGVALVIAGLVLCST